jgi:spore germination cell wall hydrolase CwlJ-like protein
MNRILTPAITLILVIVVMAYTGILTSLNPIAALDVTFNELNKESQKEVRCLAQNIYYESAYEPDQGQLAVAFVTLNRTKHPSFPSSVCEVVTQKTKYTCQFSWFCQDRERKTFLDKNSPNNEETYNKILQLATFAYVNYDKIVDPTNGAIFYHADYVNPRWKNVTPIRTIGRHIFYIQS